jgi:hypothetical protein
MTAPGSKRPFTHLIVLQVNWRREISQSKRGLFGQSRRNKRLQKLRSKLGRSHPLRSNRGRATPSRNSTKAFCHQSSSVFQSSCPYVTQDSLCRSHKKGRRKCSKRFVGPLSRFSMPAGVMVRNSKPEHRIVVKRIAWTKTHCLFKVSNRRVRHAMPGTHKSP